MRTTATLMVLIGVLLMGVPAIAENDEPAAAPTPPTVIVTDEDVQNQEMDNERRTLERALRRDGERRANWQDDDDR